MKLWRIKNNCTAVPTSSAVPNINTGDGCTADHFLWSGGSMGSTNELYRVNGGGHTWPGATTIIGVTNEDFNASVEIWRFFRKYKLSMFTGIPEIAFQNTISIFPNPCADLITVNSGSKLKLSLYDITGKQLIADTETNSISVRHLEAGIYFIHISSAEGSAIKKLIKE
jgi:polyhydroxybutyrate depolymerase